METTQGSSDEGSSTADRSKPSEMGAEGDQQEDSGFMSWDVEEVCRYLKGEGFKEDVLSVFRVNQITGKRLRCLSFNYLDKIGIRPLDVCQKILCSLRKLWPEVMKVFNDSIHGHMELHPLLVKIINTPQFNRLRNIKQLGGTYCVYPGASHNRFEHSIGVAHLAGELVKALKERQPELDICCRDVLCVQVAGLCHDLGHGPFSHLFETFVRKARQNEWKHEKASLEMFEHMVEVNKLEPEMKRYGLDLPGDLNFIKWLINGKAGTAASVEEGRTGKKSFLYEIVANKRNGIDVDKWDYFARDCHHLGIQNSFDYRRFLKFARVCEVDGKYQICTRDKEAGNLYDMFHTRYRLHQRAYQHKVANIIENMIIEAFLEADPYLEFEGSGGTEYTLSTAIDDMEAYTKLTDDVFGQILNSSSEELAESRQILEHIVHRRHPRFVGEIQVEMEVTEEIKEKWKRELANYMPQGGIQGVHLEPEDFVVDVIKMDYGMKNKNPINEVRFYKKSDPDRAFPITKNQVSKLLPDDFDEQWIRVYCKKIDKKSLEAANGHFVQWCMDKNFPVPFPAVKLLPEYFVKQWIGVFFEETMGDTEKTEIIERQTKAMDHFAQWCKKFPVTQVGDGAGAGAGTGDAPGPAPSQPQKVEHSEGEDESFRAGVRGRQQLFPAFN